MEMTVESICDWVADDFSCNLEDTFYKYQWSQGDTGIRMKSDACEIIMKIDRLTGIIFDTDSDAILEQAIK